MIGEACELKSLYSIFIGVYFGGHVTFELFGVVCGVFRDGL